MFMLITKGSCATDQAWYIRSPDLDSSAARASVGGWGLGAGHEDVGKAAEEDEEDEPLDWDQAQVCGKVDQHVQVVELSFRLWWNAWLE